MPVKVTTIECKACKALTHYTGGQPKECRGCRAALPPLEGMSGSVHLSSQGKKDKKETLC